MLQNLSIKNYALIEDLSVDFERGLNIITGETGAGKSIIIDALSLVLGERADTDMVRKDAQKAVVEAVFEISANKKLRNILERNDLGFSDELIIRREISIKGQSRSFINDTPVSISILKEVGDVLVDLHGQHDHQSLLRTETHIELLDDFGGLEGLCGEYYTEYRKALDTARAVEELVSREHQLMERKSFYEFQIREIDAVNPQPREEDDLERELIILENAERLFSSTERLYQMLYEGDNSIHDQLILLRNELGNLASIDPAFSESEKEAGSASAVVDELAKFIQQYNSKIDFNPNRLEEIRSRLGNLALLKKKYGGTLEAVITHREKIEAEVNLAENFSTEIESLKKELDIQRRRTSETAQRLSVKRNEIGEKAGALIVRAMRELGIPNAVFDVKCTKILAAEPEKAIVKIGKDYYESNPKGVDLVEFYISTNVGEDPRPLSKVASGGEVSRIMLALKMVLAKSDRLPLLVFDEIDVGVSGKIAQVVGQCLHRLSQFHQVIAITHLPQIAGFADTHFMVKKIEDAKRSKTLIRKLTDDEQVHAVAVLLSGDEITDSGLESARELMIKKGNTKKKINV